MRYIAFGFLGLVAGFILGAVLGLLLGGAWVAIADTSSSEGYSGYVVAYWGVGGAVLGAGAGAVGGGLLARRRRPPISG